MTSWNNDDQEHEMRDSYDKQCLEILSKPDYYRKSGDEIKVGFESEVAIHPNSDQVTHADIEKLRDEIIGSETIREHTDKELGVAQIEFRTPPIVINKKRGGRIVGYRVIESFYRDIWSKVLLSARQNNCRLIRCGTNPFLPVMNSPRTNKPKYQTVPDYYNFHRRKDVEPVIGREPNKLNVGDAAIVSLFQSFQVNLQANSFDDAIDKMNRSFMIAPYLLALSANSRYLEYLDTGIQDLRMKSWELSHDSGLQDLRLMSWEKAFDTRKPSQQISGAGLRVGLPENYFENIYQYLARAGQFPFILHAPENALQIAIGMTWLDSRIKFIDNSLVVELRLLPTQPTIDQELFLFLLYIGRLHYSQSHKEALMPLNLVRYNREAAMVSGMSSNMWFPGERGTFCRQPFRSGLSNEIKKAKDGLQEIGLLLYFDTDVLDTIIKCGTPSNILTRSLSNLRVSHDREGMIKALHYSSMLYA